jgi:hypothetical protein
MTISGKVRRSGRQVVSLAGAIALMTAASISSEAGTHKAAGMKTHPTTAAAPADPAPQQKSSNLRYFGGPKSMMSAQLTR